MTDEELNELLSQCNGIDQECDTEWPWARTTERLAGALADARRQLAEARATIRRCDELGRDVAEAARAAERRRLRTLVEQWMADAVHEVSDLRVMMREHGKTETTYADFTRAQGTIDTCERVLVSIDAAPAPMPPDAKAALADADRLIARAEGRAAERRDVVAWLSSTIEEVAASEQEAAGRVVAGAIERAEDVDTIQRLRRTRGAYRYVLAEIEAGHHVGTGKDEASQAEERKRC